jgi:hypothetical protein
MDNERLVKFHEPKGKTQKIVKSGTIKNIAAEWTVYKPQTPAADMHGWTTRGQNRRLPPSQVGSTGDKVFQVKP